MHFTVYSNVNLEIQDRSPAFVHVNGFSKGQNL